MQRQVSSILFRGWGLLITAGLFCGCMGAKGLPQRKKMPDLYGPGGGVEYPLAGTGSLTNGFPFSAGYVDIVSDGMPATFFSVAMPDAALDSLAIGLALSYKPMAETLLAQWVQQGNKGVVIDLRSSRNGATSRSDYLLEDKGAFSLPVVFLWDEASAGRATTLISLLRSLTGIQCRHTAESDAFGMTGRTDCFRSVNDGLSVY